MRHPLRTALLAVAAYCQTCGLRAQEKVSAPPLAFELAVVKPVDPNAPGSMGVRIQPGRGVVISGFSLKALIATAFRLAYWQISGGEGWMANDLFVLEAQPPESLRSSIADLRHSLFEIEDPRLREMLQTLLVQRFQLKFHQEAKTGNTWSLQRSGKPLRLDSVEPEANDGAFSEVSYVGGKWFIIRNTMPQLARFASRNVLHAAVTDETQLEGIFDYKQVTPDAEPNYSDNSDSFLRMISEAGLKLVRGKGPVDTFVIDSASRPEPN